jgi:hypothetical protein
MEANYIFDIPENPSGITTWDLKYGSFSNTQHLEDNDASAEFEDGDMYLFHAVPVTEGSKCQE